MRVVSGNYNGTAAAVYICIGFVPDFVDLIAVEDSELAHAHWGKHYTAAVSNNGFVEHTDQAVALYTKGTGFEPYEGGDTLTSTTQSSTTYGEGVYLGWDLTNYAKSDAFGYDSDPIDTWTLDTAASNTGHFNEDTPATVSRIGVGSPILIEETFSGKQKWALIETLTAGAGEAANEVLLSRAIASGKVLYIGGLYSMIPIAVGKVTPAGFKVNATTEVNVNDETNVFVAGTYDN